MSNSNTSSVTRVLLISPRILTGESANGRDKLLNDLIDEVGGFCEVRTLVVPTSVNGERKLARTLSAIFFYCVNSISQRLPMQALLFFERDAFLAMRTAVRDWQPDVIYLDSVKVVHLLSQISGPKKPRIVVDVDDLLSRRIRIYQKLGITPGRGKLGKNIPQFIYQAITTGFVSRWFMRLEARLAREVERSLPRIADALVLSSDKEARILKRYLSIHSKSSVPVFAHPLKISRSPHPAFRRPDRVIFIGDISQPQNADSIRWCEQLASSEPSIPIHIYGSGTREKVQGQPVFHGYVEDLCEIYTPESVAVCMTRVAGGLKTKILEAWARGIPVLVTEQAMEGIDLPDYGYCFPWSISGADIRVALSQERASEAARMGFEYLSTKYSPDNIKDQWRGILGLST